MPSHRFRQLLEVIPGPATVLPGRPELTEPWLLGSSAQSGIWASESGLPYAFADFINPGGGDHRPVSRGFLSVEDMSRSARYRRRLALCADSDAEAERLASSARMAFVLLVQGQLAPIPSVETTLRLFDEHGPTTEPFVRRRRSIVGGPEKVRHGIEAAAAEYGC